MRGNLKDQALLWRSSLLEASALIEGEIDFSDEADVPKHMTVRVCDLLTPILADLHRELNSRAGERIRDGLTVVIAGPPNAGKSTLLNALARRDIAIVSEHAGTTRDLLEVHLDMGGLPVTLIDTAGLRESTDPIERIGMSRARQRSKDANLVLWLSEKGIPVEPDAALARENLWVIFTKSDLAASEGKFGASSFETAPSALLQDEGFQMLSISAANGENLGLLIEKISAFARVLTSNGETGLITRERHRQMFQAAGSALERIVFDLARPIEFLAEDLRIATRALESLVGGVDVEDVLGEIFSRFCVGK
jgi:tRNA modification GTPase